eukprot:3246448-Ditylum_brightwellii.AAC.1
MALNCSGNHVRPYTIVKDCAVIVVSVWCDIGNYHGVGRRNIICCSVIAEILIHMALDCVEINQAILAKKVSIHQKLLPHQSLCQGFVLLALSTGS